MNTPSGETHSLITLSCHLYLMLLQKHAVLYEAFGFFPAALQFVQVEIIEGAIIQAGSNPWTPVVS